MRAGTLCAAAAAVVLVGFQPLITAQPAAEASAAATEVVIPADADAGAAKPKPRIEIALLLDTSGSMSGLINQARTELWRIVNQFEAARRGGQRADVYVALYEYGKSSLPSESGWIRQIVPLTTDLDKISAELFALGTNGGSEHCGQVIDRAVKELEWSDQRADLKCIFIAGNEPFTQGPIDYHQACRAAADKNITVSTIHCGPAQAGQNGMWADAATLADGSHVNINHNKVRPHVDAPQDAELARLNQALNATYLAYGAAPERRGARARQLAQDENAERAAPAAIASRTLLKAGRLYKNSSWDLVDAVRENGLDLAELKKDHLPEELRKLSAEQLKAHVAKLQQQRVEVQAEIKALSAQRAEFVEEKLAEMADKGGDTLDAAVIQSVRGQAAERGWEFPEE